MLDDSSYLFAANAVVQQFLSTIASGMGEFVKNFDADKMLIPLPHMAKVLTLLMNSCVTELDCTVFDHFTGVHKFNNLLLEHSLKNCPAMSKIKFKNKDSTEFPDILPVEQFKKSWNDLKSLKSQDFICNEQTLEFIQENFPDIESVNNFIAKYFSR
jgi:hypothetical protein